MCKSRIALKPSDWPVPDRDCWARALAKGDFLEEGGAGCNWRHSTVATIERYYGYALFWLMTVDALDPAQTPLARWSSDHIQDYLAWMRQRGLSAQTCAIRLQQLERALAAIDPTSDRSGLKAVSRNLGKAATPSRDKRQRLQEPARLVQFGIELMTQAQARGTKYSSRKAALYRDGLQIALLALRPLRRKNFSEIELGRHLTCRENKWWLNFDNSETKNGHPIEVSFPVIAHPRASA